MPTAIQSRRGTTSAHSSFTGLAGELTVDSDKDTVIVHDGSQAGGFPLARASSDHALQVGTIKITGGSPGAGKYLQSDADGDASWATIAAGGDTSSSSSSATDNQIARFDATTGKLIQTSQALIDDSGVISNATWQGTAVASAYIGAGVAKLADDQAWTGSQRGTPSVVTDGTLDLNTANNFKYTPSGADVLEFTNETAGQAGFVTVINASGHAISLGSELKKGSSWDVSTAGTYLVSYYCDGTNVYVSASEALS